MNNKGEYIMKITNTQPSKKKLQVFGRRIDKRERHGAIGTFHHNVGHLVWTLKGGQRDEQGRFLKLGIVSKGTHKIKKTIKKVVNI
tara:strand:+ start:135 stop:392 length:258 start_codon:yes stop_codon:yes gene_type:complete